MAVSNNQHLYLLSFSDCSVTLTQLFGVITSPGYPLLYRNGINCSWNIQLSIGQFIQLNFLDFDVESCSSCNAVYAFSCDLLTVYDGDSNTSPMLGNPYCGDSLPPSQISSSNQIFIHFYSNHLYTGTGFKLEYNATSKFNFCLVLRKIMGK